MLRMLPGTIFWQFLGRKWLRNIVNESLKIEFMELWYIEWAIESTNDGLRETIILIYASTFDSSKNNSNKKRCNSYFFSEIEQKCKNVVTKCFQWLNIDTTIHRCPIGNLLHFSSHFGTDKCFRIAASIRVGIIWSVWKTRNDKIFNDIAFSRPGLVFPESPALFSCGWGALFVAILAYPLGTICSELLWGRHMVLEYFGIILVWIK